MFDEARTTFLLPCSVIKSTSKFFCAFVRPSAARRGANKSFVFGSATAKLSTIFTSPSFNLRERMEKSAARRIFLFTFCEKSRSLLGPCAFPPPTHNGERVEPCRARPVPFWRHGFLPPPRTSARVFACAHGRRLFASCARTICCTKSGLHFTPKIFSGNSTVPTFSFFK